MDSRRASPPSLLLEKTTEQLNQDDVKNLAIVRRRATR